MNARYTYTPQPIDCKHVYLPENEKHHQILQKLQRTLGFRSRISSELVSPHPIRHYLAGKYGGVPSDYPAFNYRDRILLIEFPPHVDVEAIVEAETPWAEGLNLQIGRCDPHGGLPRHPGHYVIKILITDYPITFWDEEFFTSTIAGLGDIILIDPSNLNGTDKSCIEAWIQCVDPHQISPKLLLHYGSYWMECSLHVLEWEYFGWLPPEHRDFPWLDESSQSDHGPGKALMKHHETLISYYIAASPPFSPQSFPSTPFDYASAQEDMEASNEMENEPMVADDPGPGAPFASDMEAPIQSM